LRWRKQVRGNGNSHDYDVVIPESVGEAKAVRIVSLDDEGNQNPYGDVAIAEIALDAAATESE
jgi:hypothetical protein